ncbi:Putative ribonuclease H protein At1g65750 [Linum perenne]
MLFADDTIIFGNATIREAERIKIIMQRYCVVSGQAVNTEKSAIFFSQNTPDDQKMLVANCLQVPIDATMGKYLGVPTDWGNTKKQTFCFILERLAAKAQSWSSILLSHAGRETMIKSVLQAIPAYIFSCFKLPKVLIKKMDAILVNFWWTGEGNRKTIHWVAAEELRRAKEEGGIGIKGFSDFNRAFLAKLAWRMITQPEALWVKVLKGLYFPRTEFLKAGKHHRPSWLWSSIIEGRNALLHGIRRNIGNGASTDINDAWIPGIEGFRAFVPENLNCRVSDFILLPQRIWDVQKLRSVFAEDIVKQILTIPLGPYDFNDRWVWHFDPKGRFSVKSCYRLIRSQNNSGDGRDVRGNEKLWRWLWQLSLPPKLRFFMWRVLKNALATKMNLYRRSCSPSASCPLCDTVEETNEHLFFSCPSSARYWEMAMPNLIVPSEGTTVQQWFGEFMTSPLVSQVDKVVFMLWSIWKNRNAHVFDDAGLTLTSLTLLMERDLRSWQLSQALNPAVSPSSISTQPVTSQVPTIFDVKIVCDGAYKASIQRGAFGVIKYDAAGRVLDGRARNFCCRAPICAEANGLLAAVDMATRDTRRTIILTDCLAVTKALKESQELWPWEVASVLASIQQKLQMFTHIAVFHVHRNEVQEADRIAKKARDDLLPLDWLSSM